MQEKPKRPRRHSPDDGRPTKYKPEYCAMLIKHRSQGLSFETFGAEIDVDRDTLYEWAKKHKMFSDAKRKGDMRAQQFWEKIGMAGMAGKVTAFSASMWIFNMKARFGWRDGSEVGRQTDTKHEYKIEWADDADNVETGSENTAAKKNKSK